MRIMLILGLVLVVSFSLLHSSPEVIAAASGQCYSDKPVYQYNEMVRIIINTPTGINDTKILIYRPGGIVTSYVIGKIGPGVQPFPLGTAGPPAGTRSVVLMDGSTALYTAYYTVMEPPPPTTPTTLQTVIQYQTVVVSTTITQPSTVMRTETDVRTVTSTVSLPPPMDLVYALFIVIIILIVALLFLVIRLVG